MAPSRVSPPPHTEAEASSSAPGADLAARRLLILYATTTGTAQDTAERVARVAARRRWHADVLSVDEWDMLSLPETPLVLFIVSTTGAGDFPSAALPFWHFLLRATLPPDVLEDVTFATFGLGDSSYAKYCWPTRKINKRLKALGAHEVCEAGEGDDQHYLGIDGTLHPWLDTFFNTLDTLLPLPAGVEPLLDTEPLPPRIIVRRIGPSSSGAEPSSSAPTTQRLRQGQRWGVLKRNERVTPQEHWQDVRLVEWETEDGEPMRHSAGDIASIRPQNLPQDIERFMEIVGWAQYADYELELSCRDRTRPLPSLLPARTTLRDLLTQHLDPFSVPRQSFFELIRHFSPPGHMQREKLDEFCTPGEGADDMYEYAQRVRRNIAEVLAEFESVRVPLEYVCEVLPLLRERQFSIASCPAERPNGVQLAVAMVEYKTRIKEMRRGVCSRWLGQLPVGTRFAFSIVSGTLRLPAAPSTPMILVGPGTGVAPIRALVHERLSRSPAPAPDDVLVLLGCRNRARDFLFGDEWRTLAGEKDGTQRRLEYRLAASRDQQDKVYVQHVLRDEGARVWDMLRRGAVLYISGSSGKMPEAVRAAVVEVCVAHGAMQEAEAQTYVEQMEAQERWQEECWS